VDEKLWVAVVNLEGQYSIWLADRELPAGWTFAGKRGTEDECLDFIEQMWTDMRPLSLRHALDTQTHEESGGSDPQPTR
jgi:MbtH protein